MNQYQRSEIASEYQDFLASKNGQIQTQILGDIIITALQARDKLILDAACGNGWLTKLLRDQNFDAQGCDSSRVLLEEAHTKYPDIKFIEADLMQPLPYSENQFDAVILNMAIMDIANFDSAFKNLYQVIKPGGKLLITLPNPEYAYPVGVWKRGLLGWLLGRKPKLILRAKPETGSQVDNGSFSTFWRPLDVYNSGAAAAGLTLINKTEIRSKKDSSDFDLNYQLYRYPLLLLLQFRKIN